MRRTGSKDPPFRCVSAPVSAWALVVAYGGMQISSKGGKGPASRPPETTIYWTRGNACSPILSLIVTFSVDVVVIAAVAARVPLPRYMPAGSARHLPIDAFGDRRTDSSTRTIPHENEKAWFESSPQCSDDGRSRIGPNSKLGAACRGGALVWLVDCLSPRPFPREGRTGFSPLSILALTESRFSPRQTSYPI